MKAVLSLIVSIHFLAGVLFLPGENFNLLNQMPELLKLFKQENGTLYFGEFLEEQFLGAYSIPESPENDPNEPFEKEQNPVPFNLTITTPIAFVFSGLLNLELFPPYFTSTALPYLMNYHSIDLPSLFHPPRSVFVSA